MDSPPPAFVCRPPRVRSLVEPAVKIAEALGRPLDEAQRLAVDVLTGVRADGRPAALEAAVIGPRQNLKTSIFQVIALARLLEPDGDELIVWSAHLFDTAQATFQDFLVLIDSHTWLSSLVDRVDRGNGEEQITFRGRRRLRFRARAKTGARGLSGDAVIMDEAFALQASHMGALLPILSTRRRALVLYGSSAGGSTADVLRGVRDRGRKGGPTAPAYVEWCVPGSLSDPGCLDPECMHEPGAPGCRLDDEALWAQSNPAVAAGRITLDYLRSERAALPPGEFARERLGWWEDPAEDAVDLTAWAASGDPLSTPLPRPVRLGVAVSPKGRTAAVVAAGRRADGLWHVELLEHRPGTEWLPAYLAAKSTELQVPVHVQGGQTPSAAVIKTLEAARVRLVKVGLSEFAAASDGTDAEIRAGRVRHRGDPRLTAGLTAAGRRDVGDGGWAMSWKDSSGDACPGMAMVLALSAVMAAPAYDVAASAY